MEFKLAYQQGITWNQPTPIFEYLHQRGLNTIERDVEMAKGYFLPQPNTYESVHKLNLGMGCDSSHFGGVDTSLPNHAFQRIYENHTIDNDEQVKF